jgi:hypothetical protein
MKRRTTFGRQRPENASVDARFLDEVSASTETTRNWVALRA